MFVLCASIIFTLMVIGIIHLINPILSKKIINFIKAKLINSTKIINILYGLYCLIIYLLYQYYIVQIIFKNQLSYDIINDLLFTFLFFYAILLTKHEPSNLYYPNLFLYNSSFNLINIVWLGQMLFEIGLFLLNECIDDLKNIASVSKKNLIFSLKGTLFALPLGIYYAPIIFILQFVVASISDFGYPTRLLLSDEKFQEILRIIEKNLEKKKLDFLKTYINIYIWNIGLLSLLLLLINPLIKLYISYKNFAKTEKNKKFD